MKNLLFASALLLFLSSCSEELDCCVFEGGEQKWELVEMTTIMLNPSVTVGTDMEWQEHYLLNTNTSIFTKSRTRDGVKTTASGTFKINTSTDQHHIELTYSSENEIIGNCTNDLNEVLNIASEDTLEGTWEHCDGPGLKYQRKN